MKISSRDSNGPLLPRIAVIGASAGGLEAIKTIFLQLEQHVEGVKEEWCLVVIQHLSPSHPSIMDDIIRRCTSLPVKVIDHEQGLAAGVVYLIPANADIRLHSDHFVLQARKNEGHQHHPIDDFVTSLKSQDVARSALIICSGSGKDGAGAAEYVAEAGGQIWVQDFLEAPFPLMPEAVAKAVPGVGVARSVDLARCIFSQAKHEPATGTSRASTAVCGGSQQEAVSAAKETIARSKTFDDRTGLPMSLVHQCIGSGFLLDKDGCIRYVFSGAGRWLDRNGRHSQRLSDLLPTQSWVVIKRQFNADKCLPGIPGGNVLNLTDHISREIWEVCVSVHRIIIEEKPYSSWMFIQIIPLERIEQKALPSDVPRARTKKSLYDQELQSAHETIKALREELANSNEELQATIEELHTSNEELQSVNEELHSANAELIERNTDLTAITQDLEYLLSANDTPKIFLDSDGKIRRFTKAAPRLFHLRQQDIGRPLQDITSTIANSAQRISDLLKDLKQQPNKSDQVIDDKEVYVQDAAGYWHMERCHVNRDEKGEIIGFAMSWIDVTWIKMTEQDLQETVDTQNQELRDQNHLLREVSNSIPIMLWRIDSQEQFVFINQAVIDYSGDTDFRKGWLDIIHPEDAAKDRDYLFSCLDARRAYQGQWRVRSAKGDYRWFQAQGRPHSDGQGKFLGYIGALVDIHERVVSNEKLQYLVDRLNLIVGAAEVGLWDWDVASDALFWNAQMFRLHGLDEPQEKEVRIAIEDAQSAVHPEDRDHWHTVIQQSMQEDTSDGYQLIFRPNSLWEQGEHAYLLGIGRVFRDDSQRVVRVSGICLDVTAQRKLEAELSQALAESKRVAEDKGRFLASMSHELRTPLNGILGLSEHLLGQLHHHEHKVWLSRIINAGQGLLRLINDTLDFVRLQSNRMELRLESCSARSMVEHLAVLFEPLALKDKRVSLHWCVSDVVPTCLCIDRARVEQLLNNLVGNAIKFTREGSITIHVGWSPDHSLGEDMGMLSLSVIDTGIGIAPDALKRLGEEFFQVNNPLESDAQQGTGLGLYIVRGLLALMDGTWRIESEIGKGTQIDVEIPCRTCSEPETRSNEDDQLVSAPLPDCRPLHILVADDNDLNQEVIVHMLEPTGATIYLANDGVEVLEICRKQSIDCVFMDVHMPNMSGIQACQELRAEGMAMPIIAISANDDLATISACLTAGMACHLNKPAVKAEIYQVLFDLLGTPIQEEFNPLGPDAIDPINSLSLPDFDVKQGMALCDHSQSFFCRMILRFAEQLRGRFAALHQLAPEEAAAQPAQALIHMLKGSASSVGAVRIASLCAVMLDKEAHHQWIEDCLQLRLAITDALRQLEVFNAIHSTHGSQASDSDRKDGLSKYPGHEVMQMLHDQLQRSAWISDELADAACAWVHDQDSATTADRLRHLLTDMRHQEALALLATLPFDSQSPGKRLD